MKKNLTNAELIDILFKRDLNAPADIYVDYCTFYGDYTYPEVERDSGVCISECLMLWQSRSAKRNRARLVIHSLP